MANVIMMAGGTGGHIFPALAVAKELRERGHKVSWMGTRGGLEAKLVPPENFAMNWIEVGGVRGKGIKTLLLAPLRILKAVAQARSIIKQERPALVIGMGGFASGPGGMAAYLSRVPLLIHEQNAAPGVTNRILSRLASKVMQAFPNTFGGKKVSTVGNPVRAEINALSSQEYAAKPAPINVLILGGSQGALALNQKVPEALASIAPEARPIVRHQAGRTFSAAQKAYAGIELQLDLAEFIDDMAQAFAWADLIICRSGASTVSEISAVGLPSILVPFPFAVDDHQTANGRYLVKEGAAIMIQEKDLDPKELGDLILELSNDPQRRADMAKAAKQCAWPDCTQVVVEHCEELMGASA